MAMTVDKDTQELIVSALIKNSHLYSICKDQMGDGHFSDPSCKIIYKALSVYYKKYNSNPNINELLVTIDSCYYPTVGDNLSTVKDTCCRLAEFDEPDEEFIKDKIVDFIRKVNSSAALKEFLDHLKNNPNLESDDVVNNLIKALEVSLTTNRVFSMTNLDQVKEARASAVGDGQTKIIRSFIDSINLNLMFGGWQPGTVNMVCSPPGCFTGDTKILTSEGSIPIEELYKRTDKNPQIFTSDGENLSAYCVGSYDSVYLSDYTDNLVEVSILAVDWDRDKKCLVKDITKIKCTPDHPFMLKDGTYKEAQYLTEDDELKNNDCRVDDLTTKVIEVTPLHLDEKVPVYGIVDAKPYSNYALAINNNKRSLGIFVHNTGKTMYLINEGVNAAKQGFDILHVFIGDMVEYDGFIRYLSCISNTPQNTLVMTPVEKQMKLVEVCNQQYDNIFDHISLLAYPSLSLTVDTLIEDIIKFEKQLNKDYGMIIIDYPDNLILEGNSLYSDGGTLYSSLEKMARLTKAVVLVASQPQKAYWDHEIIPLEAASESSKKQMAVDVMLSMNTHTRGSDFGTMLLAKARKGNVGKIFRYKTDFASCQISEIDEGTYNAMVRSVH